MPSDLTKQLSREEIDQLFRFTERKLVRWYDLQIELVDHLACRIEEEMSVNSSLSFNAALEKVYKEFGLFGFAKVVQEKEAQIHKASLRLWLSEFKALFSWPKAIMSIAIAMSLYQLTRWVEPGLLLKVFGVAHTLIYFAVLPFVGKLQKKAPKLLMLQAGMSYIFFAWCIQLGPFIQFGPVSAMKFVVISLPAVLTMMASYQVFLKVRTRARDLYPEVFTA